MAIGSVWDWDKLQYDYYDVPGTHNLGGFRRLDGLGLPSPSTDSKSMGIDIEDALPSLPAGARKTGSGSQARGTIFVKRGNPLGMAGPSREVALMHSPFMPALLAASTTFLVSRFIPKDKSVLALLFFFGLSAGMGIGMHHAKYQAHDHE